MKINNRATFAERHQHLSRVQNRILKWKIALGLALVINFALGAFNGYAHYKHKKGQFLFSDWQPAWRDGKSVANYSSIGPVWEQSSHYLPDGTPKMVMIRGEIWPIRNIAAFKDALGHKGGERFRSIQAEALCGRKEIVYIHFESLREFQTTLMHEVMHAGSCAYGGDPYWESPNANENDHAGIEHLGEFMSSFMRDNPDFVRWMESNQ